MKDNSSITSKMINRNWVLKRKRRKLPSGADKSNANENDSIPSESLSNTSSKRKIKDEITSDRLYNKKKGDDGYYYECEICDLGGNLLCCDNCPKTYHLECLDPPLKRIPMGKWHCPSCCSENVSPEETNNTDSVSKQARTKITIGKSKTEPKPAITDKTSAILGKKKSSAKGKSSKSHKKLDSSQTRGDGSVEGSSSVVNMDNWKKPELPTDTPEETKSLSPVKDATDSNVELPGEKQSPVLAAALKKDRKRKHKVDSIDGQKKPRTSKGKGAADSSRKHKSKSKTSSSRGSSKPKRKRKSAEHGASASMSKKDDGTETLDVQSKDEIVSEEAADPTPELHESGKIAVETLTFENQVPGESQQVDRVLGCRVQGSEVNSSLQIPAADANDLISADLMIPDYKNRPSEENASCDNPTEEAQNIFSQPNGEKCIGNDERMEKINAKVEGNCAGSEEDLERITERVSTEENANVNNSRIQSLSEVLKNCESPVSREIADPKAADIETAANCSHRENKDPILAKSGKNDESIISKSVSSNGVTVSYEFLVKWVGKSHIHNSWISESKLKVLAKRKLDNYKAKFGYSVINICEERWKVPQRIIALRSSKDSSTEAFVKWTALGYEECTWERIDEPVIGKSSHLIDLFNQFERQTLEKDSNKEDTLKGKGEFEVVTLTEQPREMSGGSLFPHQLEALNWLRKCWQKSRNVILADEMGLGKTVSACAFISSLYFEFKAKLPCLVLVPLSTMPNWMSEFSLWAPNLNVVEYHGSAKARAILRQYEWHAKDPSGLNKKTGSHKFHVLLTTYEMVLVDSNHLRGVPWEVLVVDEGHRLKNSSSKLFGMLNTFSFQHRVLLTGTPLQNNIGEMYNLLNFLQPASFPSLTSFEEKFDDLTTAEKVDELKKLVAPHMLRRLKKDAMQNIPPKTERMVPVELSSIQAEYYRAMLTKNYQILRNIGKGVAQQSMLNIVMQLRKVCNHPYLIPGTEPEYGSVEFLHEMRIKASAKLNLLHSMLKVLHKEGHRVLIFSQMTKLLDILEDYMTVEFGPKTFERVDGSVSVADRQTAIARFNQDKSRFVFLLSTRSCGLGINLATADTVIIYDSDFNPHADIQAMNRAHRIGQSNRLLVYRLVVRASVEERILQLAKKKLMLDQLFVNKSGSQKEVEDIIRWGTEELFNDGKDIVENPSNKDETVVDIEHKSKRRTGGLGDVYTDKCTDGSSKIVWDENAIMKLLDRSNLQSAVPDNAEGDLENDMLGSVKSLEWNEEPMEEQGANELLPVVAEDTCAQNSEKKEDTSVNVTEENEWDKLLRVRWEKYQTEEEAALGRGKRLRKAVSYREAYAVLPNETLNESGGEDEKEPEPEPEREYTPAGRALKVKYTKLRARQKERLAQRNAIKASGQTEGLPGPDPLPQLPSPFDHGGNQMTRLDELVREKASKINLEENRNGQTPEAPRFKTDSSLRLAKISKHRSSSHMDISQLSHDSDLLPVLGLCAPNAREMELSSSQRNISRSHGKQNKREMGSEFSRFRMAPCSGTLNESVGKGPETVSDKFKMPEAGPSEALKQERKNSIPDHYLPFNLHPFTDPQVKVPDRFQNYGATFADFQEKMALPRLPFDEKLLPRYPFLPRNPPHPHPDLFPRLSLGSRPDESNESIHEIPTMPLLPNFKFPQENMPRYNQQEQEVGLGLGRMPPSFSSFPESHRKVLENILMRTGSGSGPSNPLKRKPIKDIWTEDELDFLWIGVRRHGRGSWDNMLGDPRLRFSKFRTAEDLSARWEEEQLKILDGRAYPPQPKPARPAKSAKPSLNPGITDGMMARALHGSRFAGPLKFRTHLTDMKLGFNDLPSAHLEPLDHLTSIPSWKPDMFRANFPGDPSVGPSDRPGTSSNAPVEQQFLSNSFGASRLGSLGLNNFELQQRDEQLSNRYGKLPSFLDNSLNLLRETHNNPIGDCSKGKGILHSVSKEEASKSSSSNNKLPHWLQAAVKSPSRPPEPELPPTVSAIAQSVRLLYEAENPTIPPFVAPGLPPNQPKDPRLSLKKKKKRKSLKFQSRIDGANVASPSVLSAPLFEGSDLHMVEPDPVLPNFNLNTTNPSSSLKGLSPSPEGLELVASGISPGFEDRDEIETDKHSSPGVKLEETESGDSSKTESDPNPINPPDVEEVSSEGTVSDHHTSENELLP